MNRCNADTSARGKLGLTQLAEQPALSRPLAKRPKNVAKRRSVIYHI